MIRPSKRREGESALEYVERLEWEKARIPKDVLNAPIVGKIARADGLKHWSESWRIGTPTGGRKNPAHRRTFTTSIFDDLPIPKRRSPLERAEQLTRLLLEGAERDLKATGQIRFSKSVMRRLSDLTGLTDQQIETMTLSALREAFAAYAARLLAETEKHAV